MTNKYNVPGLKTHIPYYFVSKIERIALFIEIKQGTRKNGDMAGLYKERLTQDHFVGHMKITAPTISHSCSSCVVHLVACWPHGQSERQADGPHQKSARPEQKSAC